MSIGVTWHAWLVLLRPRRVLALLERLERAAVPGVRVPNLWQIELGVLRMWHRILFRSETIGTCATHPVRSNWRAGLLRARWIRFPFLVWERAIAPWDLSGSLSSGAQFRRHLLGAHHDGTQCVYDLQILSLFPGALDDLERTVERLIEADDRRSRWLADLCVYADYHSELLGHIRTIQAGALELVESDALDPDISFWAYLRWCRRQPSSPAEWWRTWRDGHFDWVQGVSVEAT